MSQTEHREEDEREDRRTNRALLLLILLLLLGVGSCGVGVGFALDAEECPPASSTPQANATPGPGAPDVINHGDVELTAITVDHLSTHVMAAGDTVIGTVTLTNTGGVPLTYTMSADFDGELAPVLTVAANPSLTRCTDQAWRTSNTSRATVPAPARLITRRALPAGASEDVCVRVHLAKSASNSYQGSRPTTVDYTFEAFSR